MATVAGLAIMSVHEPALGGLDATLRSLLSVPLLPRPNPPSRCWSDWVGCAWVPCASDPGPTGCANTTWGSCGFDNNNISVHSSPTLANDGWRAETIDALPRPDRAVCLCSPWALRS